MSTGRRYVCDKCHSLVDEKFDNGLEYICPICGEIYQSNEDDVIEEEYSSNDRLMEQNFVRISLAAFSPVERKVARKCEKCGRAIMALVLAGSNLKAIYSCVCGNIAM